MHCWHFRIFYKTKQKTSKATKTSLRKQQSFFSITVIYNNSRAQTQNNMFACFYRCYNAYKTTVCWAKQMKKKMSGQMICYHPLASSCPSHLHFSSILYENWQSCFSCACSIVASVGTFCKTMCNTCQSSFFRMGKKNNFRGQWFDW